MIGAPIDLSAAVAVVALGVAAYAALRLATAWPGRQRLQFDINFSHVLMGTAMAGMAVSSLNLLPTVVWEGVFGAEAVWFASAMSRSGRPYDRPGKDDDRAHRSCHCATHTVMAVSMLYMYLARGAITGGHGGMPMPAATSGAALAAGDAAWLSLMFVVVLVVSAGCEVGSVLRFARLAALSTTTGPTVATAHLDGGTTGPPNGAERPAALVVLSPADARRPSAARRWLTPRLEAASHVAMCLVMVYMLVLMG